MGKLNWVQVVIPLVFILFSSDCNCQAEDDLPYPCPADLSHKYKDHEYKDLWKNCVDSFCWGCSGCLDPSWSLSVSVCLSAAGYHHHHGLPYAEHDVHECRCHDDDAKCYSKWEKSCDDHPAELCDDPSASEAELYDHWRKKWKNQGCYPPVCSERENSNLGDTDGHYTTHNGTATNDSCIKPGPEGANYYFKWNHGKLSGGLEHPTYETHTINDVECFESVIVNNDGYYLWVPRNSDKKDKCVSPSGDYVWYHGDLPKEKQINENMAPLMPNPLENNITLSSILGLTPPPHKEYTEPPEPVTVSPQREAGQTIIPGPQDYAPSILGSAVGTLPSIQEAGQTIIPGPQDYAPSTVGTVPSTQEAGQTIIPGPQAPEVAATAPIQTYPYMPAPYYLPPETMSVPKTVNIFL